MRPTLRYLVVPLTTIAALFAFVAMGASASPGVSPSTSTPTSTPKPVATAASSVASTKTVTDYLTVPAANSAFGNSRDVQLPSGWHAEVWALLGNARFEAWTPDHKQLLVSQPGAGTITALTVGSNAWTVPTQHTLLDSLNQPQGMAFDQIGTKRYLYVAETDQIDRFDWVNDQPTNETVLVHNLGGQGDHGLKEIVVRSHNLYFDIGSDSNATPPDAGDADTARIVEYNRQGTYVRTMAKGVRNGDGLSFDPTGTLWTAVNNRDDISYPFHLAYGGQTDAYGQVFGDYTTNHPVEEIAKITPGRNLGWPFCNPDPDTQKGVTGTSFDFTNVPFDRDVQNNPDGSVLNCGKLPPINLGLPAHSAPLGFHFLTGTKVSAAWRGGAVVAIHGSWDAQPPRAPAVLWLKWDAAHKTLVSSTVIFGGFQDDGGNRWGRPVDVVPGPDGALYVTDDQAGAVYRITL